MGSSSAQAPQSEYDLARFNPDLSLDTGFSKNLIAFTDALMVQPDGKIIVVGTSLYQLAPKQRVNIARLNNDIFVSWAAGDTSPKTFSLPIVKDGIAEPNETLTLTINVLSSGTNLGTNKSTTLTIIDNPSITINPTSLPADSGADVVLDVLGYIDSAEGTDSSFYSPLLAPSRLYDSRDISGTYQKASSESGTLAVGTTRTIKAAGLGDVPANARRVVVRITTVDSGGAGFLALYPGTIWPKNASVNTSKAAQVIGYLAVVELENGNFTVFNGGTAECGFVLDVVGYIL